MFSATRLLYIAVLGVVLSACAFIGSPAELRAVLESEPDLAELLLALEDAGLLDSLEGLEELTLFAPVDDAFPSLLERQQVLLADVLSYHAVPGMVVREFDLVEGLALPTRYANSALGVELFPTTLIDGSGGAVRIVETDLEIANGVIHKIEAILTPPDAISEALDAAGFEILLDALTAVGLFGDFDGAEDGPVTLFAPSDAAFAALLDDLGVDDVTQMVALLGESRVRDILRYHMVDGLLGASAVEDAATTGTPIESVEGTNLELSSAGGSVVIANEEGVGDATVGAANVVASNGVVHYIDQVLVPPVPETE